MGKPGLLRVIDVRRKCILEAPRDCRYVALSYVWGGIPTLQATRLNIENLSRPNGLLNASLAIPVARTILDAIELTQNIDEDYLWVDSLCIVQDDPQEKHNQIGAMDRVYGGAVLTIIAAGGAHADSGLAGVRPASRAVKQIIEETNPGLSLAASLPSQGFQLKLSVWNTRAWTYQERLLSKRFLVFTPHGVYWQCRTLIWTEDVILEAENVMDNEMMSFDDRLRFLDVDPDWSPEKTKDDLIDEKEKRIRLLRSPTMMQYMWAVEEYTRRELSFLEDIVNAFAGIQRILNIGLHSYGYYGLPSKHLDLALLWKPGQFMARRFESKSNEEPHTVMPSWSWAGWVGPVFHWARFPASGRLHEEERIRPLIHWYQWDTTDGICRVPQYWEIAGSRALQLDPKAWSPLQISAYSLTASPKITDSFLQRDRLYFQTSSATLILGERNEDLGGGSTPAINVKDKRNECVGLAEMQFDTSPGSTCEFLVISEAQWVGLHSRDQAHRNDWDYFLYFNALAVTCENGVTSRVGLGRISKKAWAEADPVWKTIVLG